MSATTLMLHLVDPRGRCDRKGFLVAALMLLGLQAQLGLALWLNAVPFDGWLALTINLAFCWVGFALVSKRLHDLGRSAWWILAAVLIWLGVAFASATAVAVAADPEALAPGTPTYWATLWLLMLPLAGGLLWLHLACGVPGPNRYGASPLSSGFSGPATA